MGDISVLLLGYPSTAKSQREFYLEAGAMVLADGGVVCIDVHNNVIMNIKIISPVLDMIPMSLGIKLAALAFRKELIDLEKRLSANLSTYRDTLFEECLRFLKEVEFGVRESSNRLHSPGNIQTIYAEATSVFFKVLQSHTCLLTSNQLTKEMERLYLKSPNNSLIIEYLDLNKEDAKVVTLELKGVQPHVCGIIVVHNSQAAWCQHGEKEGNLLAVATVEYKVDPVTWPIMIFRFRVC
ncbi:unnamed protein product [Lactuca virosa]|nr:unnamed protein product [Lactuca virosa]